MPRRLHSKDDIETHVVFNQEPLLELSIERKAFLFKKPWFDWQMLQSIVHKQKHARNTWRSSNYRSSTLTMLQPQSHLGAPRQIPKNGVDRWFTVRKIDHGTISWWPLMCPAYQTWYERLYPEKDLSSEEKFQVLCKTYVTLNQYRTCTFTDALVQTCWLEKENHGKLSYAIRVRARRTATKHSRASVKARSLA